MPLPDSSLCFALQVLPESLCQLEALKTLHLSGCHVLTELPAWLEQRTSWVSLGLHTNVRVLPGRVTQLAELSTLHLIGCHLLTELPESLGQLSALTTLHISECRALTKLPESLGQLVALKNLHISECRALTELPDSLGQLVTLTTLYLSACFSLAGLPESLGQLVKLSTLTLSLFPFERTALTGLSAQILRRSQLLHVSRAGIHMLPYCFTQLATLTELNLSSCRSFKWLPESLGHLVALNVLDLSECDDLLKLPNSLGQLAALTTLILCTCYKLTGLPDSVGQLAALTTLNLDRCRALTGLPESLGQLAALTTLNLNECHALTGLPESLGQLLVLKTLNLSGCPIFLGLPNSLGQLVALETLGLNWHRLLTRLPESLGQLAALTTLDLISCPTLTALPESLGQLAALKSLNLIGCDELIDLNPWMEQHTTWISLGLQPKICLLPQWVTQLAGLKTLYLNGCRALTVLPESLGQLAALTTLCLRACSALTELPESLGQLVTLTSLDLSCCDALVGLPESLGQLVALSTLNLSCCGALTRLPNSLGQLVSLTMLDLADCRTFTGFPESLGHLAALAALFFNRCSLLTRLPDSLGQLVVLNLLDLTGCEVLTGLPESLGQLSVLTMLRLTGCQALTGLPESLDKLVALKILDLSGCEALTGLPESLGFMSALTTLTLSGCEALTGLPESLGQLTVLTTLHLNGCQTLTRLPDSLGRLVSLTTLDISFCGALMLLPVSLAALSISQWKASYCSLVFPPQFVANAGFPAVKRFLKDFLVCGAAPLQHDRVMLLGDGGAGKTTLSMALRLHADPMGYPSSMRASLREKLAGWTIDRMKGWLHELDPRERCCPDRVDCRWCHQGPHVNFATLLSLSASEFSASLTPGCLVCHRLRRCVEFLQQQDAPTVVATASFDLERELASVKWLTASLADELRDPDLWPDLLALSDSTWQKDYNLTGAKRDRIRRLLTEASNASLAITAPSQELNASPFDVLRFIPHVMTRGVEVLAPLVSPPVTIWDFAGQLEFFPAHQFLLSSSNVIYTVVFDASYGYETSVQRLSHWLSFIASGLDQNNRAAFGDAPHQRQGIEVVLVATHTDSPHYKTILEYCPSFMSGLVDELSAKFFPQLNIHQRVFCPAYDQPHGGQLQSFCALLTDLATNKDRRLRHSFPASYLKVYEWISASRADSLATKRLPLLSTTDLLHMMEEVGLEADALGSLRVTLEAYGFLKRLHFPWDHLLADPVTWLTMVLGVFVSPVQAITLTSAQATPAITLAVAADICNAKLELPLDQVSILMSVMCELDVCYEVSGGFVFPGLLPNLSPRDMDVFGQRTVWSSADPNRVLFGRRFVVSDGGFLPSTLPLLLHRRLHRLADQVVCVRRDHFFVTLFDCNVMVRFNTATVEIRSSSGHTACSIDMAVSAHKELHENACLALDCVVFELVLECAQPYGACRSLQLVKHAFCRYNAEKDAKFASCRREPDEVLGDLAWADNVICSQTVDVQNARQEFSNNYWFVRVDQERDPAENIRGIADNLRSQWLNNLASKISQPGESIFNKFMYADEIKSILAADPKWQWKSASHDCALLATDPFWTLEELSLDTPSCLTDVPGRFGWIPRSTEVPAIQLPAVPQPATPLVAAASTLPVLHTDHSVTVWVEAFSSGRFGDYHLRARDLAVGHHVVMRCVRGDAWNPRDQRLFNDHLGAAWQHVVRLVLPCKPAPLHDCLLIPLDATAFELTLVETLATSDVDLRVALLTDVFRGLDELHGCNIVHGRLLGPQCVVVAQVGPRRVARLTDWCVPINDGFPPSTLPPPFPLAPELGPNVTRSKVGDLYALGRLSYLILSGGQPSSNDGSGQFFPAEVNALDTIIPGSQFLIEQLVQTDPAMRWPVTRCLEEQFLLRVTGHADNLLATIASLTELQQVITAALVLDGRPGLTPEAQARINDAKALRSQLQALELPSGVPDWKAVFPPDFVNLLDDNMKRINGGTPYNGASAASLLRGMRNLFHHPEQFPRDVLRAHGLIDAVGVVQPVALFRFYYARFPSLLFHCFQLARHHFPLPSEWNEWALETGLGPVLLFARAGFAEHESNFDPHAAPPHAIPLPFNAAGCRVVLTLWSRRDVTLTLTLPDGPAAASPVTSNRHHKRNLEVEARFDLAAGPGLYELRASNGQGDEAVVRIQVIDQVQFAGSLVRGNCTVQAESPAVFRLRIPQAQVQLGREYTVKVLEAAFNDQGTYRFQNGPFQPSDRRFTIPAGSQLADELVLEYTRGGQFVLHYLAAAGSAPLVLAP